jgi:hypothetical protein
VRQDTRRQGKEEQLLDVVGGGRRRRKVEARGERRRGGGSSVAECTGKMTRKGEQKRKMEEIRWTAVFVIFGDAWRFVEAEDGNAVSSARTSAFSLSYTPSDLYYSSLIWIYLPLKYV